MKGVIGAASTVVSVFVAWLPEVEELLRIFVSIAGIFAAFYTMRFYHHRTRVLLIDEKNGKTSQPKQED